ncbi:MAG: hypothetical protein C5S38_02060 [Candidatus Methanophagaceae archaeon]|jgi:hypothetical protein|nr:MAG: hypothetical protein C5S38_02060 [Methanophagales archaeon]KAF5434225.1 hypothetical protein C5S36_05480 [Methanophagales archaeon]
MSVAIFGTMMSSAFYQKEERQNSNCVDTAFQEYVQWLRVKYLLVKYEIVDNSMLFEYEQQLISLLQEGIEDEFLCVEKCA